MLKILSPFSPLQGLELLVESALGRNENRQYFPPIPSSRPRYCLLVSQSLLLNLPPPSHPLLTYADIF
jgi:hypothetical protein